MAALKKLMYYLCQMPLMPPYPYRPHLVFRNPHIATIYCGVARRIKAPNYKRCRLELPDGDFLLVDGLVNDPEKALIICHGLEGDSRSNYNNSCANYFLEKGFSVFAWNNRSCGGKINRLPKLYHHAAIDDLDAVVRYVLERGFKELYLVGFSLGGAQILNYFGRATIDPRIKAGAAISTPIYLESSERRIEHGFGRIYRNRFLKKIKRKIRIKAKAYPDLIDRARAGAITGFDDIVEAFMVPVHGFSDRADYYRKTSPGYSIEGIRTPVLLLNALNDPILGQEAYPVDCAKSSKYLYLEVQRFGGHCAFPLPNKTYSYADVRASKFFEKLA